jgi:FixJ family two-component response regulator
MSTLPSTVFIVDDDPSVRSSLSRLVRLAGLDGQAYDSAEAFLEAQPAPPSQPACLVVDLQMPGLSGLELQKKLSQSHASCPVVFISGNGDIPSTVQAMRQGAVTFLTKPFDNDDLLRAIAEGLDKHRASLTTDRQVNLIRERMKELTERELEVMAWVITGALNKQIAAELNVVEKTIKVHRARVLEKMQAHSVAELVRQCALVDFAAAVPASEAA